MRIPKGRRERGIMWWGEYVSRHTHFEFSTMKCKEITENIIATSERRILSLVFLLIPL